MSSSAEPNIQYCMLDDLCGVKTADEPGENRWSPRPAHREHAWIDAGLEALAGGGPDAVRVDLIAKALGVTRGGFYWHFESRQVFLDALLDTWEHRSTDEVLDRVEAEGGDARDKVRKAGMLTFSKELLPIDLAVRDWARRDKSVARRLRRVDNRRMDVSARADRHVQRRPRRCRGP